MIQEYGDKELLICTRCNVAYKSMSSLLFVKYKNCPYCTTELSKISQLIRDQGD